MAGTASSRAVVLAKILICIFAMSAWIDLSGLFVELSLMVNTLPESWKLPSYFQLISQIANIAALAFFLFTRFSNRRIEVPVNYLIIIVGITSLFLLIFLWDHTIQLGGKMHSVPLLALVACLSLVDCTSTISFLAYLTNFPASFVAPYFVGDGLSALLPSIAALVQGVGGNAHCVNSSFTNGTIIGTNMSRLASDHLIPTFPSSPRFSIEAFIGFLIFIMVCSLVAFCLLDNLPQLKKIQNVPQNTDKQYAMLADFTDEITTTELLDNSNTMTESETPGEDVQKHRRDSSVLYWCVLQFWSCLLQYGVLYSIVSYAALPYGNVVFHLTLTLPQIANPLTCLFAHYFPTSRKSVTSTLNFVGTSGFGYLVWIAATSPQPALCGSKWGGIIEVGVTITVVSLLTYTRVMAAFWTHQHGRQAFIVNSFTVQCGSLVGTIIMFPLINYTNMFNEGDPCTMSCYGD
ncbi:riboflavin transporter 2-like [Glandiceps talaboti]